MGTIDVITLMGQCVHTRFGPLGFLLFSGASIIPRRIRIDDVIMRLCAAIYLRQRSAHFRLFSNRIHMDQYAWSLRAIVVVVSAIANISYYKEKAFAVVWILFVGVFCVMI